MPEAPPKRQVISEQEALDLFKQGVQNPDPKFDGFRRIFDTMNNGNPYQSTREQALEALRADPGFSSLVEIVPQSTPAPPSGEKSTLSKAWEVGTTPLSELVLGEGKTLGAGFRSLAEKRMENIPESLDALRPISRFTDELTAQGVDMIDSALSPVGIGTLLVGGPLFKGLAKYAPRLARGIGMLGAGAYGSTAAMDVAGDVVDFAENPTPEGAAKAVADLAHVGLATSGALGVKRIGRTTAPPVDAPPAPKTQSVPGRSWKIEPPLLREAPPPPKQLPAAPSLRPVREIVNASGLAEEEVRVYAKRELPDLRSIRARLDTLLKNEVSNIPDTPQAGKSGKLSPEQVDRQRTREVLQRRIKALDLLIEDKTKAAGYSTGDRPPIATEPPAPAAEKPPTSTRGSALAAGRPAAQIEGPEFKSWRDENFVKHGRSGLWVDKKGQSWTTERLMQEYQSRTAPGPEVRPERLLTEGEGINYGPVTADIPGAISVGEANALGSRYKVPPGFLQEMSQLPNDELVRGLNQMHQLRAKLTAAPGDLFEMPTPGSRPSGKMAQRVQALGRAQAEYSPGEGSQGAPIAKQEMLDELTRKIDALTELVLSRSGGSRTATPPVGPQMRFERPPGK